MEINSQTLISVEVHPVDPGRGYEIMAAPRVHDEASILVLDWQSDAHDVVTSAEFARDMWNHFLIADLGPWIAP